jgi:hypothetical protein
MMFERIFFITRGFTHPLHFTLVKLIKLIKFLMKPLNLINPFNFDKINFQT